MNDGYDCEKPRPTIDQLCQDPVASAVLKTITKLAPEMTHMYKIRFIKILRENIDNLGLKEAKDIAEIMQLIGIVKFD